MRIRAIKPGFWKNERLAELSRDARLLFIGLWNLADSWGYLEDRPKRIRAELFPYDGITDAEFTSWLDQLRSNGFLIRGTSTTGIAVLFLPSFRKHQAHTMHKNERDRPQLLSLEADTSHVTEDVTPHVIKPVCSTVLRLDGSTVRRGEPGPASIKKKTAAKPSIKSLLAKHGIPNNPAACEEWKGGLQQIAKVASLDESHAFLWWAAGEFEKAGLVIKYFRDVRLLAIEWNAHQRKSHFKKEEA